VFPGQLQEFAEEVMLNVKGCFSRAVENAEKTVCSRCRRLMQPHGERNRSVLPVLWVLNVRDCAEARERG
jgi:hypothetical protein